MHDIVHAPCIPLVSNCVPFRARAGACLRQWASLPGVLALESAERASIGLAVDDLVIMDDAPSLPQHSGSELVYRLDEVSAALRRIQNCAAAGDADTFVRVVADIENWGIPESTLVSWPQCLGASPNLVVLRPAVSSIRFARPVMLFGKLPGHPLLKQLVVLKSYWTCTGYKGAFDLSDASSQVSRTVRQPTTHPMYLRPSAYASETWVGTAMNRGRWNNTACDLIHGFGRTYPSIVLPLNLSTLCLDSSSQRQTLSIGIPFHL